MLGTLSWSPAILRPPYYKEAQVIWIRIWCYLNLIWDNRGESRSLSRVLAKNPAEWITSPLGLLRNLRPKWEQFFELKKKNSLSLKNIYFGICRAGGNWLDARRYLDSMVIVELGWLYWIWGKRTRGRFWALFTCPFALQNCLSNKNSSSVSVT